MKKFPLFNENNLKLTCYNPQESGLFSVTSTIIEAESKQKTA